MSSPSIGTIAPAFTASATGDQTIRLSQFKGKNSVVLYFYPKDNTPGCTTEGQDFRDLHSKFKRAGAVILGVSKDSLKSHENFKSKQEFPFELLSDIEGVICEKYDVIKEKNLYGKKYMGIERSTFLIDHNGRLAQEWRKVSVKGHAEEVLAAVKALPKT
jgi:peroxiredoxin Q/BCP